jgi:DNA-binding response OmpR family regulator
MSQNKRILLADDEAIFLKATSNVLCNNGYTCDCATDSDSVLEMLKSNDYDLLISDIKMPGNSNMELISNISKIAETMPVILVTAYPSIDNAIRALKFHVYDYLLKPVDFGVLLERVSDVLKKVSIHHKIILEAQQSARRWSQDLDNIERLTSTASKDASLRSFNSYLDILFKNMFDSVMSLKNVTKTAVTEYDDQPLSPHGKLVALKDALEETVAILKKTKNTFKSKDLGVLRGKLEKLLAETS